MCGSQAACPTIVSPSARTAAMTAFSVAITLASSRNSRLPVEAVGAKVVGPVQLDLDAELREGVDVGVEAAAPDDVAARWRHRGPPEPREQRPGEEERRADLPAEVRVERGLRDVGGVDRHLVRPRPRWRPRRGRRAARPSSRRRGCAGRSTGRPAPTQAPSRRGSAARRSCCQRREQSPTADARPRSRTTACGAVSYPAPWR